jgi:hypothetical protein
LSPRVTLPLLVLLCSCLEEAGEHVHETTITIHSLHAENLIYTCENA